MPPLFIEGDIMIYAAIVAGGKGSRMGLDIPKQFLMLGDRQVLVRTAERFLTCGEIDMVYVGVHAEWVQKFGEMCAEYGLDGSKLRIIEGGKDRTETVFHIVERIRLDNGITEEDIILTHDGVRPFVSRREIIDSIIAMKEQDGVTVSIPSTDTLLFSEDGSRIDSVPERAKLFRAQTPQTFRLAKLDIAYRSLTDEQKSRLTDTASVFISAGLPVGLIRGSERNIKLTTPTDLTIAEMLLEEDQLWTRNTLH